MVTYFLSVLALDGDKTEYFAYRSPRSGARKPWRLRRTRHQQSAHERNWPHDWYFDIGCSCLPAGSRLGIAEMNVNTGWSTFRVVRGGLEGKRLTAEPTHGERYVISK